MCNELRRRWTQLSIYLRVLILWLAIAAIVLLGIELGINEIIIGLVVAVFGVATHAFASLLALIGLIPFLGPLLVKILTLPFFWLLNGLGYFLAILAIKRGYTREVVNYRMLTFVFLLGVVLGFVLGRII